MRHILIACALLVARTAFLLAEQPARRDEEVTFRSGGIMIAGTLSLPAGAVRAVHSHENRNSVRVRLGGCKSQFVNMARAQQEHWWLRPS